MSGVGAVSASVMCADLLNLKDDLNALEASGVEYIHFDVMDGSFVPNFTLGPDLCRQVSGNCGIPVEVHLMTQTPERHVGMFADAGAKAVTVHVETAPHLHRVLQSIKQRDMLAGVAFNPGTPLDCLEYVSDLVDLVLIMAVNPGFAGQKLVKAALPKIESVRRILDDCGVAQSVQIMVDGNVSYENAETMASLGADIFVAGTSAVFRKDMSIDEGVRRLRQAIGGGYARQEKWER